MPEIEIVDNFLQPQQNPYEDRITAMLQKRAQPQEFSPWQRGQAGKAAMAGAGYGGQNIEQILSALGQPQREAEDRSLESNRALYDIFEEKRARGDKQAQALFEKINLFTGGDPEGTSMFLEELHKDPESIDPGNAYQVMTKLAGISRRTGYKPLDVRKKEAEIASAGQPKLPTGYRAAADGQSIEPIPGGPAAGKPTPGESMAEGKQKFSTLLQEMAANYDELEREGGAVSTAAGPIGNAVNRVARGEWTGEPMGKLFGTREQSIVNQIKSARPLLAQAIMQSTGMSARQLDSNRELQFLLDSLSDPSNDIEANRAILARLDQMFGRAEMSGSATPDNPQGTPRGGIKFLGFE